ncbi:nicotinate-nucleotide adenylyltransferase [Mediterraneibacter glycyrrhizinilyticus]|uniref:nicotinate-nucleotide adenylyltransferase n=1 Tax=Mediterraneibacter glycyrrhizinilyticus TaxID=342942 RepID=UPI001961F809|nr:nicotinate-nucleotide adenylyltransferase [Mediterraneibacter glycyrrhizinilyticus]MBM6803191.1 nicotinate-nucleotide adenylyltransferase [Mediterraneibacter glycyrrhizinilyticus]MDM8124786.1 nicotinate-nucleotide adenylyltransferase [Mediterraneibacter glycyrrhizinilyticus]
MKIGIMGGTFDPIHIGHLLLGEFAYENFHLDEIWFLPNGNPPHKTTDESGVSLDDRIEMVKLATDDVPYFRMNLYEASSKKHSYTYSTMRALREMYPEHEFFFILGADSLFSIEQWKNFREIFPSCTILAAMRDDKDTESMQAQIRYLNGKYGADIRLLQAPLVEISSTTIRRRAENGLSIRYMVPDVVSEYIQSNALYKIKSE